MSKIEWTEATWNPVVGCAKVSQGCKNCYAMRSAHRMASHPNPKIKDAYEGLTRPSSSGPQWTGKARFLPERLEQPLRWRKPRRIFVNSMSDLFHEDITSEQIAAVFGVMLNTPRHTFQLLTKRPERMRDWASWMWEKSTVTSIYPHDSPASILGAFLYAAALRNGVNARRLERWCGVWPIPNAWIGVSIESRDQLARVDLLRETPAAVRWISAEPLLGSLGELDLTGIDWVVVGGESGPGARPMHPAWAREIRDQCQAQGVAFFFKQWGRWALAEDVDTAGWDADAFDLYHMSSLVLPSGATRDRWSALSARELGGAVMMPVGKKRAGRRLDGQTWDEYPGEAREVAQ